MDPGRRSFVFGRRAATPLRPPWSTDAAILAACTGCGDCVTSCPAGIIEMGAGKYPEIRLDKAECTFCGRCAEVCRADVFDLARPPFRHKVAIGESCLSKVGTECRSCEDACPEMAIRFRARLGRPAEPVLRAEMCTGCGACLAPCPVGAIQIAVAETEVVHA